MSGSGVSTFVGKDRHFDYGLVDERLNPSFPSAPGMTLEEATEADCGLWIAQFKAGFCASNARKSEQENGQTGVTALAAPFLVLSALCLRKG